MFTICQNKFDFKSDKKTKIDINFVTFFSYEIKIKKEFRILNVNHIVITIYFIKYKKKKKNVFSISTLYQYIHIYIYFNKKRT